MRLFAFSPLVLLLCASLLGCGTSHVAGGATDTETGGVARGVIADSSGVAASARISFYPVGFDPSVSRLPDSLTTTADRTGAYAIRLSCDVEYNLSLIHI